MNAHTAVSILTAAESAAKYPDNEEEGIGDSDEVWGAEVNKSEAAIEDAIKALAKSAILRSEASVRKVDLFQQYLANRQARAMAATEAQKEDPATSIETCMDLLNAFEELDNQSYNKAAEKLAHDIASRRMFVKMPPHRRLAYIQGL